MIELHLKRFLQTPNSTAGVLTHGDKFLGFVIEDGKREYKEPGKTRIPEGVYMCTKRAYGRFYTAYNGRWGHSWVIELNQVANFEAILIHIGNTPADTRGCLLLNDSIHLNREVNEWHGGESTYCYKRFYDYIESLGDEPIQVTVV